MRRNEDSRREELHPGGMREDGWSDGGTDG